MNEPNDRIKLTPAELEEIKDEVRFKTKVSEDLKWLKSYVKTFSPLKQDVRVLQAKVAGNWRLILVMLIAVVGAIITVSVKALIRGQ